MRITEIGRRLALGLVLTAAFIVVPPPDLALAATVHVPCSGAHGGGSGLVAAIEAAADGSGPRKITLAQGCTYDVVGVVDMADHSGLPAITRPISISAAKHKPATTIERSQDNGNLGDTLFNVVHKGSLALHNITVANGRSFEGEVGACLRVGPGAATTLDHSRVTGCYASTLNGETVFYAIGAGIYNNGSVLLDHSRVDHNRAEAFHDDHFALGGGIATESLNGKPKATLTISHSRIDDNEAPNGLTHQGGLGAGGGIAVLGNSAATITDTQIDHNRVEATGGTSAAFGAGVAVLQGYFTDQSAGSLVIDGGSIEANRGDEAGGGVASGGGIYLGAGGKAKLSGGVDVERNVAWAFDDPVTPSPVGTALGGGIYVEFASILVAAKGTSISTNVVKGTTTLSAGGGVANLGSAVLTGVAVSGNVVTAAVDETNYGGTARGGGLYNDSQDAGVKLVSTAVTRNVVVAPNDGLEQGGGIYQNAGALHIDKASAVAHNYPDDRFTAA